LNIFSSDTNFTDDENENNRYDEDSKPLPSENKTLKPIKENQADDTTAKSTELLEDRQEFVTEKVEGVSNIEYENDDDNIKDTISKTHLGNKVVVEDIGDSSSDSNVIETTDEPEMVVRDLEARNLRRLQMKKLPPQARHILLLTASLHILEGKGITVGYLEGLGFRKDNAEKQLQDARRNGLLIPGDTRKGKQKQYYLSNYKHIIDERVRERDKNRDIHVDTDITLQLLRVLSNRKYTYHNIHLETNLCYDSDYESLGWSIPSMRNKQKVTTFKLKLMRECSITVSPTRTTNISFKCTLDPFKLHTSSDLIEFIGCCGQALNVLQSAAKNRLNVVPPIPEWHITQFDYNKDIPTNELDQLSWTIAYGRLQIKYLGTIFQIYPKGLPELGECTRVEGHYSTTEKNRLKDTISDIIDVDRKGKKSPFVTAEDMLKKVKEIKDLYDDDKRI
jgi:hypothetical protein